MQAVLHLGGELVGDDHLPLMGRGGGGQAVAAAPFVPVPPHIHPPTHTRKTHAPRGGGPGPVGRASGP